MINEYSKLHAVEKEPQTDKPGYYLPHHAVVREEAATTKVQVVFDASAHMGEGKSLNDVLNPGPYYLILSVCYYVLENMRLPCRLT